jgi:hypothetical protein
MPHTGSLQPPTRRPPAPGRRCAGGWWRCRSRPRPGSSDTLQAKAPRTSTAATRPGIFRALTIAPFSLPETSHDATQQPRRDESVSPLERSRNTSHNPLPGPSQHPAWLSELPSRPSPRLEREHLLADRSQDLVAIPGDHHGVLHPHGALAGEHDLGLDGEDHPLLQRIAVTIGEVG